MEYFKVAFNEELKAYKKDLQDTKEFIANDYNIYDFVVDKMVTDTPRKTHVKIWIRNKCELKSGGVVESYFVFVRDLDKHLEKIKDYLSLEKGLELHSQQFNTVQYYVCIPIDV